MSFLHWICKTYLAKKRKKGKRKSVNQYWRGFKMLYRRVNSNFVDANDSDEVVKVCWFSSNAILDRLLIYKVHQRYTQGQVRAGY